ncbi:MAG: hypothetical protein LAQ69_29615 [Acidobacteriia bacterium]|nr:hypothetical protein [Terriglobia bacterium]
MLKIGNKVLHCQLRFAGYGAARALEDIGAREREDSGGIVGSTVEVEEEAERFRITRELNPIEPDSLVAPRGTD